MRAWSGRRGWRGRGPARPLCPGRNGLGPCARGTMTWQRSEPPSGAPRVLAAGHQHAERVLAPRAWAVAPAVTLLQGTHSLVSGRGERQNIKANVY